MLITKLARLFFLWFSVKSWILVTSCCAWNIDGPVPELSGQYLSSEREDVVAILAFDPVAIRLNILCVGYLASDQVILTTKHGLEGIDAYNLMILHPSGAHRYAHQIMRDEEKDLAALHLDKALKRPMPKAPTDHEGVITLSASNGVFSTVGLPVLIEGESVVPDKKSAFLKKGHSGSPLFIGNQNFPSGILSSITYSSESMKPIEYHFVSIDEGDVEKLATSPAESRATLQAKEIQPNSPIKWNTISAKSEIRYFINKSAKAISVQEMEDFPNSDYLGILVPLKNTAEKLYLERFGEIEVIPADYALILLFR